MWVRLCLKLLQISFVTALVSACSPNFMYDDSLSLSSLSLDANLEKGQALYSEKCASCHNSFASSTKKLRSEEQLTYAIENQPTMQFLSSLSKDDRLLIAYALSDPQGAKTPIYACKDPLTRGLSFDKIRRLSRTELSNTLESLLGSTLFNDSTIQTKLAGLPSDQIKSSPNDFLESPSTSQAAALFDISLKAAELLGASASLRSSVLDSCASAVIDEPCARRVASSFGAKVYRRPLTNLEVEDSVSFFTQMGGSLEGLQLLVIRFLQGPTLVYHLETQGSTVKNGRFRLTDYEIASRISYQTAATMPDAQLLEAARLGELQSLESVRTHVKRLLDTNRSKQNVNDFFRYYSKLQSEPIFDSRVLSHAGIDGSGLGPAMRQEAVEFLEHVFWTREGNFRELMTSTAAFPRTPAMASILETSVVTAQNPVSTASKHKGLLHRPALLTNAGDRTSPIIRGAHIRQLFLCDDLGPVPAAAVAAREQELGDLNSYSNREKTTLLTNSPACLGCHSQINNLGFPFENFNQLGGIRATEPIFNPDGSIARTFPIHTSVTDPKIETGGASQFANSSDLAEGLALSKKAQACFAKKVFEFYKKKIPSAANDSCLLSETASASAALSLQTVIVNSIANEDIFWRKDTTGEPL